MVAEPSGTGPRIPSDAGRSWGRLAAALALSLLLHALALRGLERAAHEGPTARPDPIVDLEVRVPPLPPPAPPRRPTAPEPPKPKFVPLARLSRHVAPKNAPPPRTPPPVAPPPPNAPPPPAHAGPPPPIRIGVSLESTVAGSDFAAPVGSTMYGQAPTVAAGPSISRPYWAPKYVAPYKVAELPVLVSDFKAAYPPDARKAGIEGEVVMMLTIDPQGKVARVKQLSGPGHGLDEAAAAAARKFVFKPAKFGGEAVATEIRYVYSFEIE